MSQQYGEVELEVHERPALHTEWIVSAGSYTVCGFSVVLYGWTATETTGSAAASVDIYDNSDHAGYPVLPVRLAQGESAEAWYGDCGILFKDGVHVNVSSGAARGSIFFRHHRL
jgi:hypothetical protein